MELDVILFSLKLSFKTPNLFLVISQSSLKQSFSVRMLCHVQILVILLVIVQSNGMTCNVTDYGARGDNRTDDTAAIQKALDACISSKDSWNIVLFPSGFNFLSYPLAISHAENMTITIESDAILQAQPNITAWPVRSNEPEYTNFLEIGDSQNIQLNGNGLINGIFPFTDNYSTILLISFHFDLNFYEKHYKYI